jgi:hypothetical protein
VFGAEATESDTHGLATFGVGFVFNRRIGITPGISVPFGILGGSEVAFALAFAMGFGG